jgi:putative phosphotransacetylase
VGFLVSLLAALEGVALAAPVAAPAPATAAPTKHEEAAPSQPPRTARQFVPVSVSARHCHLSASDLARLFGTDARLTQQKPLSQPGQFAAEEKVTLVGPRGSLEVRVLGPERKDTQVEITQTEARILGLEKVPVRLSGDLGGTPGLTLVGPKGTIDMSRGVIVAQRHLHANPADARRLGVRNGQSIAVRVGGKKGVTFAGVKVRVDPEYKLDLHLDTDEANAARIEGKTRGVVVKE